jgi:hypothetical protein
LYNTIGESSFEFINAEDSIFLAGIEHTSQDMVQTMITPSSFDRDDVERFLDNADRCSVARRVTAERAALGLRDIEASLTTREMFQSLKTFGKRNEPSFILFEEKENKPLGHLWSDRGKAGKMCDERFKGFGIAHRKWQTGKQK